MNEEQFRAYLDKVQRGEQTSEQERYQAMMFLNSGMTPNPVNPTFEQDAYYTAMNLNKDMVSDFKAPMTQEEFQRLKDFNSQIKPMSRFQTGDDPKNALDPIVDKKRAESEAIARMSLPYSPQEQERTKFDPNQMPFLNPGGSDLTTKANMFGRSLENPSFKGAGVVAGLSLGMGLTREILGGVGGARQQSFIDKYYRDKQRSNEYDTISASGTTNTLGGSAIGVAQFGGEFDGQDFQGQPMQEQQANEMQQIQQVVQVVAGALQQGAQPQEVVQMLMQQGMPQEQAVAVVEEVMTQMQGGGQQEQQMAQQGQPQMQDQQMMKYGGKSVGDLVSFKYGGKKISGRIKKIENGKIYV